MHILNITPSIINSIRVTGAPGSSSLHDHTAIYAVNSVRSECIGTVTILMILVVSLCGDISSLGVMRSVHIFLSDSV